MDEAEREAAAAWKERQRHWEEEREAARLEKERRSTQLQASIIQKREQEALAWKEEEEQMKAGKHSLPPPKQKGRHPRKHKCAACERDGGQCCGGPPCEGCITKSEVCCWN